MLIVCLLPLILQMPRELGSNSKLENALMVIHALCDIASICAEKLFNYLINKVYTSMVVGFIVLYATTGGLNEATQSRQSPLIQVMVIQGTNQVWSWLEKLVNSIQCNSLRQKPTTHLPSQLNYQQGGTKFTRLLAASVIAQAAATQPYHFGEDGPFDNDSKLVGMTTVVLPPFLTTGWTSQVS